MWIIIKEKWRLDFQKKVEMNFLQTNTINNDKLFLKFLI